MARRLAERLQDERRKLFIGRKAERALFLEAVEALRLPFSVPHIFGLGGVGKTTLLENFSPLCAARKTPCIVLDARNLEPTPEAFRFCW